MDIQTLHRVHSRLVAERRNLIIQLRAILLERGIIFPVGRKKFEIGMDALLAESNEILSPRMRQLVGDLRVEWKGLDTKIEALNTEFIQLARNDAAMRRLTCIPSIGFLNATALVAAVGDASSFKKARDLGAWLGLVPKQHSTGGPPPGCLEYQNVATLIYALCSFRELAQRFRPFQVLTRLWGIG